MKPTMALRVIITAVLVCTSYSAVAESVTQLELERYEAPVVVLDFWASWCVPCRRSFPWLNAMHAKYSSRGLVIIRIKLDNDPDAAAAFLEEYPADFQIHYDTSADLAGQYDIQGMPSSVVNGRDGDIAETHIGFTVDALTGATPSGAIRQDTAQTFTRPSGNSAYTVPADNMPLDDTIRDTRVALTATW